MEVQISRTLLTKFNVQDVLFLSPISLFSFLQWEVLFKDTLSLPLEARKHASFDTTFHFYSGFRLGICWVPSAQKSIADTHHYNMNA